MADQMLYLLVATFPGTLAAETAFDGVQQLSRAGVIGSYDAAIIAKDIEGRIHVHKTEQPTERGVWTGLVVGGIIGLLVPPFLLVDAALGAVVGGLIGHLRKGMPTKDLAASGQQLQTSAAALIAVGDAPLQQPLQTVLTEATQVTEKTLSTDHEALKQALRDLSAAPPTS